MSVFKERKKGEDVKIERLNVEVVQFCRLQPCIKVGYDHVSCLRFQLEIGNFGLLASVLVFTV